MNLQHQLEEQLKVLHLGGFLQTLDLRLQQVQGSSLGYVEFLQLLVQDEIERREAKKLNLRLSRASFEEEKTLEGFDFSFNPKLNAKLIRDLGNCSFIEKKEHVLFYGSTGVGKVTSLRLWGIRPVGWDMKSSSPRQSNSSGSSWLVVLITPGKNA
jgi:DNA replication protein DnaC